MAVMTQQKWEVDLDEGLDFVDYRWLNDQHPDLMERIQRAVAAGASPAQVRRRVMRRTDRYELANRCEHAATWLVKNMADE